MRFFRKYNQGWYNESYRHSLAAKGIKTRFAVNGQQLMPSLMPSVAENKNLTRLAVDFADASITFQELQKLVPPEKASLVVDKAAKITADRQLIEETKARARRMLETPIGSKKEEKTAAGIPTARKIEEEEKTEEELALEQRLPFFRWLKRLREGDFTTPVPPEIGNESEIIAQRGAAAEGVQVRIERGDFLKQEDWENLEKIYHLSHVEINTLKASQKKFMQEHPSALRKVGRVVGKEALAAEEAAAGFLKKGWGNLKERGIPSMSEISGGTIEDLQKKAEAKKAELKAAEGIFNPLGASWMGEGDDAKLKQEKKRQVYADAISAQRDLDALFENKDALAKTDLSGYVKGERAFRKGDREMLLDAITELDAQHMKLQDRMWHVEAVRGNILHKQTMDQTIAMASDDGGKMMPNFLFGGGGGNAIVKQTKKINQIKESIKKSSNEVAGRMAMLRNKLKRMDATVPPQSPVPEVSVKVFRRTGVGLIPSFDEFEGQLKHQNPVLEGIQKKEIKNPALGKLDAGEEQ